MMSCQTSASFGWHVNQGQVRVSIIAEHGSCSVPTRAERLPGAPSAPAVSCPFWPPQPICAAAPDALSQTKGQRSEVPIEASESEEKQNLHFDVKDGHGKDSQDEEHAENNAECDAKHRILSNNVRFLFVSATDLKGLRLP